MSENFSMESRSVAAGSDVDWEQLYREGETPWEKGAAHPALIRWLNENPLSGRVLVPGCGFGYDVRALAATGAEVVGLDIAPSAITTARAVSSLRPRIVRSRRPLRPRRSARQVRLDF